MIRFFLRRPAPVWLFGFLAVMWLSLSLPLRAETLRGPGGLPPGLVAAMLGSMKGKALNPQGCASLGDLRGCFGREEAKFRGAGKEVDLRAVAWGREGKLQKLRWRSVGREGNREVYRGRGIEGWWRAVPLGYEEGFELLRRPQGRGAVEVELEANRVGKKVGGGLRWGGVRYGKLWVTDARGRRVPAVLREEGRRIWIRIEGRGWEYPLKVDPLVWLEQAASFPTGLSSGDEFGFSVALSGDGEEALVGAPYTNGAVGAAYVYTYDSTTGTWGSPVALAVPSGESGFGYAVALSDNGEVALVGAPNLTDNNVAEAVYVYTSKSPGTWSSTPVTLAAPSGSAGFGYSLALSGNGEVAIVGASFTTGAVNNNNIGEAYVYTSSTEAWSSPSGPVALPVPSGATNFGSSVALSSDGTVALVGSPQTSANTGVAFVYTSTSPGTWSGTPVTLAAPSGASDFGSSVALLPDGTAALIGAFFTNSSQGSAYFYGSADLDLVLDAPNAVAPGGHYTEQGILTNDSGYASPNATLNFPIPVGANYQGFSVMSSTQGSCTASSSSGVVSSVSCDVGSLAASGGSVTASVALGIPSNATTGTEITETANVVNASPSLSAQATTAVAVAPTITGLTDETVTVGQAVPPEGFSIGGTGTLMVTASSSNTTLLPDSGIGVSPGCDTNGASCTLTLTPASGEVGTTTVTVTVANGYGQETSASFALTVNPPGAPTISGLVDETVTVGAAVPSESFTIGGAGTLTVTASSSNTTLLPDSGITVSPGCDTNGASCTLTLMPVSGQVGTTTVTVTVANGYGQEASASFSLTVASSVPAVSGLEDISTTVGSPAMVEDFTVSGVGPLSVETETTNAALLPEAFIEVSPGCGSGSGEVVDRCTLTLSPTAGMTGEASVLVTVTDAGGQTATGLVTLYVEPSLGTTSGGTSGGGSVGVGMLLGLLVLVGLKRRRKLGGRRV